MLPYVRHKELDLGRSRSLGQLMRTILPLTALIVALHFPLSTAADQLRGGPHINRLRSTIADPSPFGWRPCPHSQDDRWRCGSIKVPYDYHNTSDTRTMQIETVLFQSGKTRSNQTIVINPGEQWRFFWQYLASCLTCCILCLSL